MSEKYSSRLLKKDWENLYRKNCNDLTHFLKTHSNLPGPRANLTLAFTIGELFLNDWETHQKRLMNCIYEWGNSGEEYLLLCRNIVIGYLLSEYDNDLFTKMLYEDNFNSRWRPREAVTLGLQKTLQKRPKFTLKLLEKWNTTSEPIVLRNTLMILAEPKILQQYPELRGILRKYIHQAMNLVREADDKKEDIKLLQKSLGFIPSVAAIYDEKIVSDLIEWADADFKTWKNIVKSNVKKKRFLKLYPEILKKILQ
jgi:hypothetical protein